MPFLPILTIFFLISILILWLQNWFCPFHQYCPFAILSIITYIPILASFAIFVPFAHFVIYAILAHIALFSCLSLICPFVPFSPLLLMNADLFNLALYHLSPFSRFYYFNAILAFFALLSFYTRFPLFKCLPFMSFFAIFDNMWPNDQDNNTFKKTWHIQTKHNLTHATPLYL